MLPPARTNVLSTQEPNEIMSSLYTAVATAVGDGRAGSARSDDGLLDVEFAVPQELGGRGGATNPEQLFAAGYAACFNSALRLVAAQRRLRIGETSITARVGIGPNEAGGFGLTVALAAALPNVEDDVARELLEAAHAVCPYSNATRGNVDVTLELVTAAAHAA
jgi:Ohr subfamily peroxiredoxin